MASLESNSIAEFDCDIMTDTQCPICNANLQSKDQPCPNCGNNPNPKHPIRVIVDSKLFVIAVLFLVTGFLGLPLLWASRGFSRTSKVVLSIVVILYTLLLFWITAAVLSWSAQRIRDSLGNTPRAESNFASSTFVA